MFWNNNFFNRNRGYLATNQAANRQMQLVNGQHNYGINGFNNRSFGQFPQGATNLPPQFPHGFSPQGQQQQAANANRDDARYLNNPANTVQQNFRQPEFLPNQNQMPQTNGQAAPPFLNQPFQRNFGNQQRRPNGALPPRQPLNQSPIKTQPQSQAPLQAPAQMPSQLQTPTHSPMQNPMQNPMQRQPMMQPQTAPSPQSHNLMPNTQGFLPQTQMQPHAAPQTTPQSIPLAMPQTMPQTIPQTIPQAMPQTMPQAMPQTMPLAIPQANPQAVPQSMPHAQPQPFSDRRQQNVDDGTGSANNANNGVLDKLKNVGTFMGYPEYTLADAPSINESTNNNAEMYVELKESCQGEKNGAQYYRKLSELANDESTKKTLISISDKAERRCGKLTQIFNAAASASFVPETKNISLNTNYYNGLKRAITEESKALKSLSDAYEKAFETSLKRQINDIIIEKLCQINELNLL